MIRLFEDLETLSRAAAKEFELAAGQAVGREGRFCVALAGGKTPERTYALLAAQPLRGAIPWDHVHIFWGDERCVPSGHPDSNEGMARRVLLDRVPIPARRIHPLRCAPDPRRSAAAYAARLHRMFDSHPASFDLLILGLGADGHTASLFPGNSAIHEDQLWVTPVSVPGQPYSRLTLTPVVLNRSVRIIFLVSGASKAAALKEIVEGRYDPDRWPAQQIRPLSGETEWLVDREAGRLIEPAAHPPGPASHQRSPSLFKPDPGLGRRS